MKNVGLFTFFFLLALAVNAHTASAHQPEYIDSQTVIHIPDPTTSRAYYGELTGTPTVYILSSTQEFSLYLNILSPYLPEARKDFTVRIADTNGPSLPH